MCPSALFPEKDLAPLSSLLPALGRVSIADMGPGLPAPPVFQVKASLDTLAQKIATFTDVGNSLAHAEHLLKDLTSFEEKSSVRPGTWAGVGRGQPAGGAHDTMASLRKAREGGSLAIGGGRHEWRPHGPSHRPLPVSPPPPRIPPRNGTLLALTT